MALLVPLEKAIAGRAEAMPDQLGLVLPYRPDRLPLGLQPLQLRGRSLPIAGLGECLRAHAERFLLREVLGPRVLPLREILVAAGEEAIARGAETFPRRLFVLARTRTDGFPLGLERLDRIRGGNPVGRLGERLGALAERDFPLQVLAARLRLRFEEGIRAPAHLVDRGLEPPPEHLTLVARAGGDLLPLLLQIPELPCGLGGILHSTERLGSGDQLLLHAGVRPPLPVVRVPELLRAGPERGARRFETLPNRRPDRGCAAGARGCRAPPGHPAARGRAF